MSDGVVSHGVLVRRRWWTPVIVGRTLTGGQTLARTAPEVYRHFTARVFSGVGLRAGALQSGGVLFRPDHSGHCEWETDAEKYVEEREDHVHRIAYVHPRDRQQE